MDCSRTALGGGSLGARPIGCRAHCTLVWETPVIHLIQPLESGFLLQLLLRRKPIHFLPSVVSRPRSGLQTTTGMAATGLLPSAASAGPQTSPGPSPFLTGHVSCKSPGLTTFGCPRATREDLGS